MCARLCVWTTGRVSACVLGIQRVHCDMVLSLKALESGTLSSLESNHLQLSTCFDPFRKFHFLRSVGGRLQRSLWKEEAHYGFGVSWKHWLEGQCQPDRCSSPLCAGLREVIGRKPSVGRLWLDPAGSTWPCTWCMIDSSTDLLTKKDVRKRKVFRFLPLRLLKMCLLIHGVGQLHMGGGLYFDVFLIHKQLMRMMHIDIVASLSAFYLLPVYHWKKNNIKTMFVHLCLHTRTGLFVCLFVCA